MKFLWLTLLFATLARASLVATIHAETGFNGPSTNTCDYTYTAPVSAPSFDFGCLVPNNPSPSQYAYAEIDSQGPMHNVLKVFGGVSAVGCTPGDGCPQADAELTYSDVWTITGATGDGAMILSVDSNVVENQFRGMIETNLRFGVGNGGLVVPFVFGQPFPFSYMAQMFSFDGGYGQATWSLDIDALVLSCIGPFEPQPGFCQAITATVTSQYGDPFLATGPAPLVIVPEPATSLITGLLLVAMKWRRPPGLPRPHSWGRVFLTPVTAQSRTARLQATFYRTPRP